MPLHVKFLLPLEIFISSMVLRSNSAESLHTVCSRTVFITRRIVAAIRASALNFQRRLSAAGP